MIPTPAGESQVALHLAVALGQPLSWGWDPGGRGGPWVPRPLPTRSPAPVCLCRSPTPPCPHLPGARPGPSHSCPPAGSQGAQIIGGREVAPHSRPYMASVSFGGQHHCGGFLLRSRWVVSAAHCFSHRDPRAGLVVLGAHTLRPQEPTRQVFGIEAVTRHPDYQPATHTNDICLLRLNGSAVLGPAVGLLHLPRSGARPPAAGARCRVAGWGFVSDFEEPPPGLMEAEVRVLGLDVCNSSWRGQLSPHMLCTRSADRRRRGFCSGDSGGPLVCMGRAHGLISFSGLWCGDPKTPDVYTQVSAFVAWIWGVVRGGRPPPRIAEHRLGAA
ncbi:serine protease 57 isoform X2 [Ictidomys tridecemlineatus]